jgi:nucleoside-diphosphate-sugar epimerase
MATTVPLPPSASQPEPAKEEIQMPAKHAVVVGALGVIGRAIVEQLTSGQDWSVVGLSRRQPDFETRARHISVDLGDRSDAQAKLAELGDATHVFFAAYQAMPTRAEEVEPNLTLLRNSVESIAAVAPRLEHVNLMQGGKAYGCHLGAFKTPAKETDPRHMPPNFYYDQEDWLKEASAGAPWGWSALRPEAVCGFAVGNPMNLMMVIAAYGAICRELGVPFQFPGKPGTYTALYEVTDARILSRAAEWAATTPECAGEIFNITNGDCFRWQYMWPRLADFFGLEHAEPRTISLTEFMADKGPVWDRMVERYGLQPYRYEDIVSWGFGDAIFGSDWDIVRSTHKARAYGFEPFIDSEDMFLGLLGDLQRARVIPDWDDGSMGGGAGAASTVRGQQSATTDAVGRLG